MLMQQKKVLWSGALTSIRRRGRRIAEDNHEREEHFSHSERKCNVNRGQEISSLKGGIGSIEGGQLGRENIR